MEEALHDVHAHDDAERAHGELGEAEDRAERGGQYARGRGEALAHGHLEEDQGELAVRERERPQAEVAGRVGDRAEHELDGLDEAVHHHVAGPVVVGGRFLVPGQQGVGTVFVRVDQAGRAVLFRQAGVCGPGVRLVVALQAEDLEHGADQEHGHHRGPDGVWSAELTEQPLLQQQLALRVREDRRRRQAREVYERVDDHRRLRLSVPVPQPLGHYANAHVPERTR